jgi:hypothetical protein
MGTCAPVLLISREPSTYTYKSNPSTSIAKFLFHKTRTRVCAFTSIISIKYKSHSLFYTLTCDAYRYDIVSQFKQHRVTCVYNLQKPGEHADCGDGILDCGWSYDPRELVEAGISCRCYG